jgi:hypothetical protein
MLSARLRVLYLHGFASGPTSRKACFFAERLASLGLPLEIPDLSEGDFESLTITGQLQVIERVAANRPGSARPLVLIGSSLGGYLAALYAARHSEIDRLILLAPAFNFRRLWENELGPQRFAAWRENGTMPVFHYGLQRELPLSFGLMQDATRYEPVPVFPQPALIFHGTRDAVVPVQQSEGFAAAHDNVRLERLDSGHELTDVLDEIWRQAEDFLLHGCYVKHETEVLD